MPDQAERQESQGHPLSVAPDVVARRLADEVVLVHLQTNRIYTLNATAARFWELLQDGLDLAAITRRLGREFDVEQSRLEAEITELVGRLSAERLVCG
jgi:hypothetical protein